MKDERRVVSGVRGAGSALLDPGDLPALNGGWPIRVDRPERAAAGPHATAAVSILGGGRC